MSDYLTIDPDITGLSVEVEEPFTVCVAPEGEFRIHPKPHHLGDGKLVMMVNCEHDTHDPEYCVLGSDDLGETWDGHNGWPTGNESGRHLATAHTLLPDRTSMVVYPHLFTTATPGSCIMPTWRSNNSGKTWSELEAATVEIPYSTSVDIYDPPDWFSRRHTGEPMDPFVKSEPPRICDQLFSRFGRHRISSYVTDLHVLDDGTILAFIYLTDTDYQRKDKEVVIEHRIDGYFINVSHSP